MLVCRMCIYIKLLCLSIHHHYEKLGEQFVMINFDVLGGEKESLPPCLPQNLHAQPYLYIFHSFPFFPHRQLQCCNPIV